MAKERDYYIDQMKRTMEDLSLDINVKVEDHFPGERNVGGKYSLETNTITLYLEEIRNQCKKILGSEEKIEDYFKIIFLHELGHSQDLKLEELVEQRQVASNDYDKLRFSVLIEENAWNFVKKMLPHHSPLIKIIMNHSMAIYEHPAG